MIRSAVREAVRGAIPVEAAIAMPAGAIALWHMDQATTAPRLRVPNAIAAATPTNILPASLRRMFANAKSGWASSGTRVDAKLTGPDGSLDASTFTVAGDGFLYPSPNPTLAAGTYTMAMRVKRNTGTDQLFKMSFFTAANSSATKTATDSWQWFTHSATVGAGAQWLMYLISHDRATGMNVQMMDAMLLPGTVTDPAVLDAAAAASIQGDIYLTAATYAGGEVDFAADGRYGVVQFPTAKTLATFTTVAMFSKTAAGLTYQGLLNKVDPVATWTDFAAMAELLSAVEGYLSNSVLGTSKRQISLLNQGYHMLTFRYDGSSFAFFIDDCKTDTKTVAAASTQIKDLFVGLINSAFWLGGKLAGTMAIYDRALSDSEVRSAYAWQLSRVAVSGISAPRARFLMAEGDSITENLNGYFYKYLANASPVVQGRNIAVSGSGLADVQSRAAALDAMLPPAGTTNGDFILTLNVGANLPVGSDLPTFIADYAAYCDARRTRGWFVVICTILPRSDVGFNVRRNTINTEVRTWVGTHCDAIVDFAANSTIGEDGDSDNLTYYYDGVHPTDAGQVIMETIYRPVINSL